MKSWNVVITGASRGIGLELVRTVLREGHEVLAVAREPEKSKGLRDLKAEYQGKLTFLAADVADDKCPSQIVDATRAWPCVDLLINNAGIFEQEATATSFMNSFRVNSVAPFLLTKALVPQLKKSSQPRVCQVTSQMGSIADNRSGGYYSYRASKAALNMINKSLSVDEPWLTTIVIHPGWVKTDMGGPQAPMSPPESAEKIWRVVSRLESTQSGRFYNYQGAELPW
ncbi:MAG: short-chain dehydrogenase [Bdellovibrio sp.]|nr:MAG: short-chain dehydrogenase [Bdellovibrio sp.]